MSRTTKHDFEREEVMAYLDGELAPARAAALAGHLERCDECRAVATQFRQLSERLLEFPIEKCPDRVSTAVFETLEASDPTGKSTSLKSRESRTPRWRVALIGPHSWVLASIVIAVLIATNWYTIRNLFEPARFSGLATTELKLSRFQESADRLTATRALYRARSVAGGGGSGHGGGVVAGALDAPTPAGPMIAQTVSFLIVANDYNQASAAVDRLAASQGGYAQKLATSDHIAAAREFSATMRVPAAQLGEFLDELRKLGHVEQETRTNEEVTDQYVDLQARIKSARASEQRMLELLATRTGKLEDVLDAERELARIREEIESMEGQRNLLAHRVSYATVEIELREEYREQLHPGASSTTTGLRNSLVDGMRNLEDGVVGLLVFLFAYGPSILFWCALFLVPGYFIWRWSRSRSHELQKPR